MKKLKAHCGSAHHAVAFNAKDPETLFGKTMTSAKLASTALPIMAGGWRHIATH